MKNSFISLAANRAHDRCRRNLKRSMKQKTSATTAISPLAVGKVGVLLSSCAALSGPIALGTAISHLPKLVAPARPARPPGRLRTDAACDGSYAPVLLTLRYRDGDESSAEISAFGVENQTASHSCLTEQTVSMVPQLLSTLFLTTIIRLKSPPAAPSGPCDQGSDQEQLVMDEYLEFIERRYSRMLPKPEHSLDFQSVVWGDQQKWCEAQQFEESPVQQDGPHEEVEDDPLIVLGLSDLASDRLRQRLHLPTKAARGRTSLCPSLAFFVQLQPFFSALRRLAHTFAHTMQVLTVIARRVAREFVSTGRIQDERAVGAAFVAMFLLVCGCRLK